MGVKERKKQIYAAHSIHPGEDERRVKAIVRLSQRFKGERLLDVGCGDGSFAMLIAEAIGAREVFGVDISPTAVSEAMQRGIQAAELDIDEGTLPFPDEHFDMVFSGNLIHHLYDPDHLLDELYRVLKPEGVGIICNRNLGAWHNRVALLLGYQPWLVSTSLEYPGAGKPFIPVRGAGGRLRGLTLRALKQLVELHGFRIQSVQGTWDKAKSDVVSYWVCLAFNVANVFLGSLASSAPLTIISFQKDTRRRENK